MTNADTVELNTTPAQNGDLYGDADGCQDCDSDEFIMVEINAARGQRKRIQVCDECSEPFRDAPKGLYDPTALGYTDGCEYDGYY
jgi:hypothetical protein